MVRKNYKWNISKEEGVKIVNEKVKEILSTQGEIEISELNFFIQSRSRNITIENNKKKKNLTNFIRNVLGGLRNFLEDNDYKITQKVNRVFIDIKKDEDEYKEGEDIYFLNDWIIVD